MLVCCIFGAPLSARITPDANWPYYGGDAGGMRYSRLTQFNPENVSRLKMAWILHTGDVSDGKHGKQRTGFEATPIIVDGLLIFSTGFNRVIAVNPEKGTLQWAYDPKIDPTWDYGDALVNRGVATWLDVGSSAQSKGPCRRRIYEAVQDARLIALDAATGMLCSDFGDKGEVSLRDVPRYRPGQYHMTSPPAVIDDRFSTDAAWSVPRFEEVAERCGLHRSYYSGVEFGVRNVPLVNIEKIAKGLRKSSPELFSRA